MTDDYSNESVIIYISKHKVVINSTWLTWFYRHVVGHIEYTSKKCVQECESIIKTMQTHADSSIDELNERINPIIVKLEELDKMMYTTNAIRQGWIVQIEAIYAFKYTTRNPKNLVLEQQIIEQADKIEMFNTAINIFKKVDRCLEFIQKSDIFGLQNALLDMYNNGKRKRVH